MYVPHGLDRAPPTVLWTRLPRPQNRDGPIVFLSCSFGFKRIHIPFLGVRVDRPACCEPTTWCFRVCSQNTASVFVFVFSVKASLYPVAFLFLSLPGASRSGCVATIGTPSSRVRSWTGMLCTEPRKPPRFSQL